MPLRLTANTQRFLQKLSENLQEQIVFPSIIVFVAYFFTAKISQYIFFTFHTSPAVIWPPAGIALAAVLLSGYRMWFPIAAAQLIVSFTSPSNAPLFVVLATSFAYTISPIVGAYLLRKLGFENTFSRTRDALLLISLSFIISAIAPTIIASAQWLAGSLTVSWWGSWSRIWTGMVFSILVVTPTILTWTSFFEWRKLLSNRRDTIESFLALAALSASVYIIFWTKLPQLNIFLTLYFLFATLFWIGLRLGPRSMSLGLLVMTTLGVTGSIFTHTSQTLLTTQLFADELFIILIAPIFLILSTLVEERRLAAYKLKESIAELQGALSKLGREDESKNEFIATLAHELRNPLAPIVSTLEYLKLEEKTPETHRLIESAEEQTHIMRRLLDDLLDVARVTQKRFKLQQETLTVQSAITRSINTVELFMQSQGHTLLAEMPERPMWVYGDPVRLSQIFTNILYNAAKYTHRGGHIRINAHEEGNEAVVSVTDDGVGIEQERLSRIFEPFLRTNPHHTVGSGLGIGLSLTKRLVEMHNGSIEAQSAGANQGSTFTVRIPLSPQNQNVESYVSKPFVHHQSTSPQFRILVVDDNEAAAHGIERLLTRKGHQVLLATNGESALLAVQESLPDIVLLDIGLPDIDGYEVARRLRKHIPSPYIVALTGYGQDEDKTKAREAGFNYHLTKPVGLADIENVLDTIRP